MTVLSSAARAANWYAVLHDGKAADLPAQYPAGGVPRDPWGLPVVLSEDRRSVRSSGPDRLTGTADDLVMDLWRPEQVARAQVAWLAGRRPLDADAGSLGLVEVRRPGWLDPWGRPVRFVGSQVVSLGPDGRFSSDDLIDQRGDADLVVRVRGQDARVWLADPGGVSERPLGRGTAPSRWSPGHRLSNLDRSLQE